MEKEFEDHLVGREAIAAYMKMSPAQLDRLRKRYEGTETPGSCPLMRQIIGRGRERRRILWAFKWSLQLWCYQVRQAEEKRRISYLKSKGRK